MTTLLEVNDLRTYFYQEDGVVKAVAGMSYDVQEGETVAIVGESGCGKSVSALSLLRLIPHPPGRIVSGEALFDGRDLLALSDEEIRRVRGREIAMIFQEPMTSLNPVLSIERQLTEAPRLHLGMTRKQSKGRALELMEMVGIPDPEGRIDQFPHHFSGGMRQRVMIAIALSCNPKMILADEPTTALDVTIQAQILELMMEVARETGVAMVIITHNLGVVARYADRINVMYAGNIVERGSCRETFSDPRHPYTMGLLGSVPLLDQPRRETLEAIEGEPPDLSTLPTGCSFQPRCKFAIDLCSEEYPPEIGLTKTHRSACWVAESFAESKEAQ